MIDSVTGFEPWSMDTHQPALVHCDGASQWALPVFGEERAI